MDINFIFGLFMQAWVGLNGGECVDAMLSSMHGNDVEIGYEVEGFEVVDGWYHGTTPVVTIVGYPGVGWLGLRLCKGKSVYERGIMLHELGHVWDYLVSGMDLTLGEGEGAIAFEQSADEWMVLWGGKEVCEGFRKNVKMLYLNNLSVRDRNLWYLGWTKFIWLTEKNPYAHWDERYNRCMME